MGTRSEFPRDFKTTMSNIRAKQEVVWKEIERLTYDKADEDLIAAAWQRLRLLQIAGYLKHHDADDPLIYGIEEALDDLRQLADGVPCSIYDDREVA